MTEKRVVDSCVTLMRDGKPYGKKHLLNSDTDEFGNRLTQCGIVVNENWFVYQSNMEETTWSIVGCKRCQAVRYPKTT